MLYIFKCSLLALCFFNLLKTFLVQFSHSMSDSLEPHGLQHARLRCSSTTRSLLKLMSIKSMMPSNHSSSVIPFSSYLQSCPASGFFPNESVLPIRWAKYWSFSFSISPSNEYSGLISFRIDWFDLLAVQGTLESSPTPQFKNINSSALSFLLFTCCLFYICLRL